MAAVFFLLKFSFSLFSLWTFPYGFEFYYYFATVGAPDVEQSELVLDCGWEIAYSPHLHPMTILNIQTHVKARILSTEFQKQTNLSHLENYDETIFIPLFSLFLCQTKLNFENFHFIFYIFYQIMIEYWKNLGPTQFPKSDQRSEF